MQRRIHLASALAVALLASCSSSSDSADDAGSDTTDAAVTSAAIDTTAAPTTATEAATTTAAATTTVPACSRPAAAGRQDRTIEIDGIPRHLFVYVPSSYTGADTGLVLALHGSGSSAAEQLQGSKLESVADEHGFIVAAPDAGVTKAVGDTGPTGGVWNVPGVPYVDGSEVDPNAPDDVSFLNQLVDQLSDEFCITATAVSGTSGGGRMASALGCFSDRFDVIAPAAGLRISDPCTPLRPVDIVAFHGTADVVNPYLGGGPASWGPMTVPDAAAAWAALQHCTAGPEAEQVSPSVSASRWTACDGDTSVQLYSVEGGGHNWPGGEDAALARPEFAPVVGVTTQEISAGELLWEVLSAKLG